MKTKRMACLFDEETYAFIEKNAADMQISSTAVVRLIVRERMMGRSLLDPVPIPASTRRPRQQRPEMEIAEELHDPQSDIDDGAEEEPGVDADTILERVAAQAEAAGHFEPLPPDPEIEPLNDRAVRRVPMRQGGGFQHPELSRGRFSARS